ncbi:MAG TPA: Rne/Rng family ribonuclease [Candidatus Polarisedimenticolia bacterium]|nr:Rne/Rng family ribonuclease [Candidatus Polarisedimenticolia bacterium]
MSKSMLVNVTAEEENRVAIVDNGVLDTFEIETLSHENIKGNIYKATVEGVNSALEAAFVNYGGERAAFLPLDEVNFRFYPSRGEGSGGKGRGARITRHLEKGMEVLVQVIRDAFANKPPTLSTYYSLPGRYLVLMPGAESGGISRKIEDEAQRDRLRGVLDSLTIPDGFGVIVRTAGMETNPHDLQADLEALLELWRTIERASQQVKPPALIFQERDLVLRTIRDYFTSDIEEVLIDDEAAFSRARKFFEAHMPDKAGVVKLYSGDKPIFMKHNLEEQIERIYKRVVQLKSGGSISIDQTEALTAIDVNSARSVRSANSEDTATRTNLEAADEIARQLRLRDIGGLIVIDFIDMETSKHVRQVERAFSEAMSRDKARYDLTRISKLGLMEVSRQRIKATKASSSFMECPVCAGDGTIKTPESAARAAFRKIQARVARGDISGVKAYLPPEAGSYLLNQKRDDLYRLESRHKVHLEVVLEPRMKPHQFEMEEVRREEAEITPMVTAETVDQALASGAITLPPPRTEVPVEAAPASSPQAVAGEGQPQGRRRRRRRGRGRGSLSGVVGANAGAAAATHTSAAGEPLHATATRDADLSAVDSDQPVFSEGPGSGEGEDRADEPIPGRPPSGPPLRVADLPLADGAAAPHHKRRRRRRRRGRRGQPSQPGASRAGMQVSEPRAAVGSAAGGNGSSEQQSARPSVAWQGPSVAPPPIEAGPRETRSAPAAPAAEGESATGAAVDGPAAGGDRKPRRRWWRRSAKE